MPNKLGGFEQHNLDKAVASSSCNRQLAIECA
jgi:hypothetical protein